MIEEGHGAMSDEEKFAHIQLHKMRMDMLQAQMELQQKQMEADAADEFNIILCDIGLYLTAFVFGYQFVRIFG